MSAAVPFIELDGVGKTYEVGTVAVHALRRASLNLDRGEMVAVMGPSGSGKSTLMHLLGLLAHPTYGSYRLDGQDTGSMGDDRRARLRNETIGFVFQSFHLLAHLTAVENVAAPLVYRGERRAPRERKARGMLERVGLGDRAGHRPDQLSGGQRQRVAIARALCGAPALILADEPTGALDEESGQAVMDLLAHTCRSEHTTVVVVTHNVGVAAQCTRVVRIERGRLRESVAP